jgi:hypothetical protein
MIQKMGGQKWTGLNAEQFLLNYDYEPNALTDKYKGISIGL